jgi:hypothetical protein
MRQAYALLPHVKITELLLEVDDWTGFTRHFTHLKSEEVPKDRVLLLTAILADAINLGLTKMAESCPGSTYARLGSCCSHTMGHGDTLHAQKRRSNHGTRSFPRDQFGLRQRRK